jgi:uncharacterized damage-inducible protein DinB
MSQGLTPEFVLGYRAMMLDGIAREAEITKKVIGAVPDAKAEHRPDPHARTAKELMWHLANSDVQFLDGIADLKFNMETPEHKPQTAAEVVAWYDKNMQRGVARVAWDRRCPRSMAAATMNRSSHRYRKRRQHSCSLDRS